MNAAFVLPACGEVTKTARSNLASNGLEALR
jgi:hypothetical protein